MLIGLYILKIMFTGITAFLLSLGKNVGIVAVKRNETLFGTMHMTIR